MKIRWRRLKYNLRALPTRFFQWVQDKEMELLSSKFSNIHTVTEARLPPVSYNFLDDYIQRFLNSKSYLGATPGEQLMLVCGPEEIGKSDLIKKNLKAFAEGKPKVAVTLRKGQVGYKNSPYMDVWTNMEQSMRVPDSQHFLLVSLDFEKDYELRFEAFLHRLEQEIVKNIMSCSREIAKTGHSVLPVDIIAQILLHGKQPSYILMYLKDHLSALMNDLAQDLIDESTKSQIGLILTDITTIGQSKDKIKSLIIHIIETLVKQNPNSQPNEAALRLCIVLCKRIEYEYRPKQYTQGYYRSGIETTDFLLDVMNFLCGLHPLCKEELQRQLDDPNSKPNENYILSGNHIDCAMVMLNLNRLSCFEQADFLEWYDHLILRVHKPSLMRTHFPVILQIGYTDKVRDVIRLGRLSFDSITVVQVYGYTYTRLNKSNLSNLFSGKELRWLWPALGIHPKTWRQAIKCLENGYNAVDIRSFSWSNNPSDAIKLRSKINRVFASQRVTSYLDEGLLRWRVAQQLEHMIRCKGLLYTEYQHVERDVISDPIQKAMADVGLTNESFYYDTYHLTYLTDLAYLQPLRNELYGARQGILNYINYRWWKIYHNPIGRDNMKFLAKKTLQAETRYDLYPKQCDKFVIQEYYYPKERFRLLILKDIMST